MTPEGIMKKFRVQFSAYNYTTATSEIIDGVYCKELYADQIATEENGLSSQNSFTQAFGTKNESGIGYEFICPNLTKSLAINEMLILYAQVVPCDEA